MPSSFLLSCSSTLSPYARLQKGFAKRRATIHLVTGLLLLLTTPVLAGQNDAGSVAPSPPVTTEAAEKAPKAAPAAAAFDVKFPAERLWEKRSGVAGIEIVALDAAGNKTAASGQVNLSGVSQKTATLKKGKAKLGSVSLEENVVTVQMGKVTSTKKIPILPGWMTLLPALLAILLALWTREVLLALSAGVFLGALLLTWAPGGAFVVTMDTLVGVLADKSHMKVILFTLGMGALVGIIAAAGGTRGAVEFVRKYAKDPRSTALSTWVMGMLIFFDDYASTLLVGNTMRPVTDAQRISREKLAYIVDSTAATIASLALASTWIGYEVSTLGEAMKAAGVAGDPYKDVFVAGLPSRFYPIFALLFVGMLAHWQRDFGPMLKAERRARKTGKVLRDGATPLVDDEVAKDAARMQEQQPRLLMAVLPIMSLVLLVLLFLAVLGADASYDALLYSSVLSVVIAGAAAIITGALDAEGVLKALLSGIRSMTLAVMVLCLAWGMNQIMVSLHAGPYLAGLLAGSLPAWSLPTLTFLTAAVMALATGTSWGTMGILFPVVVPIVATYVESGGAPLFLAVTSSVLAGAVMGDHCSPISDTTVLSSVAAGSDHVDHTRTQMPYALSVGGVSILFGTLPAGFGVSPWLCLVVGIAALLAIVRFAASPVEYDSEEL
ncbi:MAG: Na+/H+ antiporter NhaC family protein [Deltaproteobacteria bacterium]|nr:Na+/H+ antiporter NhaC family protein [Deltaproteobacteria bacterium]